MIDRRRPRPGPCSTKIGGAMRKYLTTALIGVLATFSAARADEEKVALDKLPAAVSAAAKKRFPHAELIGASKEVADGKTMYEVELKDGGRHVDASFTADGKLAT